MNQWENQTTINNHIDVNKNQSILIPFLNVN